MVSNKGIRFIYRRRKMNRPFRDFTAAGHDLSPCEARLVDPLEKPRLGRMALPAPREYVSLLRQRTLARQPQLMTLLQAATSGRRLRWSEGFFIQLADPIKKDAHAW
jgi:hypothetical protein